ncbi:SPFH domain-containing protein [Flammeovirga agarivorans]|uniref:Band 7 domain-containing protein n=1 Tax=Flammeovirga agarivorans TaxID=2726742 RepID=A0A7X8SQK7_9BACT|nr:SPFH domain-containing protein [Flammeovirga agarivorans]NLR94506.1 hypothetical protein [Flammeovirga agarivorans]
MTDKKLKSLSGYWMIIIQAALFAGAAYVLSLPNLGAVAMLIFFIDLVLIRGYFTAQNGESVLVSLMGKYKGTVINSGFYWTHPFRKIQRLNQKDHINHIGPWNTFAKDGVELEMSVEIRWRVEDAAKVFYELSDPQESAQSIAKETAQTLIEMYPYENNGTERVSLRLHSSTINSAYATALKKKFLEAGIVLESARFNGIRSLKKKHNPEEALTLAQQLVNDIHELKPLSDKEKSNMQVQLISLLMTEKI